MSKRLSFALAIAILFVAAVLRLVGLASIPPGLNALEAQDIQIVELVRFGQVEVLYELESGGREGLYHILLSAVTTFTGNNPLGYRLVSVWFGLLTLALVYTLARRLYGRLAGLLAMAGFAVPMWSILLSRTVARETVLPFFVVAVMMSIARALPVYRRPNLNPSTLPFATLGFILGFGLYVHPAHYLVVLAGMVFIAYMVLTRQPMSRRTLGYLSFTIVILIIVATPYLITVLRNPTLGGAARISQIFTELSAVGILRTVWDGLVGFVAVGDASILRNLPGRPYTDPLSMVLILWGVGVSIRRVMESRYALPLILLVLLLPVALLAPDSPNFMGYVAVLPVLAVFFAIGAKRFAGMLPGPRLSVGLLVVLLVGNALWSVQGLARWTLREDVQAAYHLRMYALAQYLDNTASDTATVVCAPTLPTYPTWLSDADGLAANLALMMDNADESEIRYAECGSGFVFTNGGEHQQVILLDPDALEQMHPVVQGWVQRGDLVSEGVPMNAVVSMIVEGPLGDTIGRFTTTAPAGYAPDSPGGVGAAALPVGFEGNLTFLGYERSDLDNAFLPGDIVTVITYWRVDGPLPNSLNIFVHMLFDAETLVTQTDTISIQPGRLQPRDVFVQVTFVPLPDDIPEGNYQISVGAYQPGTDERFAVLDNGEPRGNRLFLNEVSIVLPPEEQADSGEEN